MHILYKNWKKIWKMKYSYLKCWRGIPLIRRSSSRWGLFPSEGWWSAPCWSWAGTSREKSWGCLICRTLWGLVRIKRWRRRSVKCARGLGDYVFFSFGISAASLNGACRCSSVCECWVTGTALWRDKSYKGFSDKDVKFLQKQIAAAGWKLYLWKFTGFEIRGFLALFSFSTFYQGPFCMARSDLTRNSFNRKCPCKFSCCCFSLFSEIVRFHRWFLPSCTTLF